MKTIAEFEAEQEARYVKAQKEKDWCPRAKEQTLNAQLVAAIERLDFPLSAASAACVLRRQERRHRAANRANVFVGLCCEDCRLPFTKMDRHLDCLGCGSFHSPPCRWIRKTLNLDELKATVASLTARITQKETSP